MLHTQSLQQGGRTVHKHCTYHHQQEHGKHQHHLLRRLAQIASNDFRLVDTTMTYGEHTTQVVVDGTSEDTAKDNPQIGHRTELGTHNGTEDGTRTCDIQKLNHEDLP